MAGMPHDFCRYFFSRRSLFLRSPPLRKTRKCRQLFKVRSSHSRMCLPMIWKQMPRTGDTDDHGDTVVGDMAEDTVGEAGEEDTGVVQDIGVEEVGEVAGDTGVDFVPRILFV